jgi:hypothetical protein
MVEATSIALYNVLKLEPCDVPPKQPIQRPINQNKTLVPPTDAHVQIRRSPDYPGQPSFHHLPVALATLLDGLPVADVGHGTQIVEFEALARPISPVEVVSEPDGFLIRNLRGGWEGPIFEDRAVADGEDKRETALWGRRS